MEKGRVEKSGERTQVTDYVPTALLLLSILLLIVASFIPNKPAITNGLICVTLFAVGLVYTLIKNKNTKDGAEAIKAIDFETIGLLLGLFLMIGGITNMGVIDAAADLLSKLGGGDVFVLYTVIV